MTGDSPQPGETPREANPWAFADPDVGWRGSRADPTSADSSPARPRHPRRRPPQHVLITGGTGILLPPGYQRTDAKTTGDPAETYATAAPDVADRLDPALEQPAGAAAEVRPADGLPPEMWPPETRAASTPAPDARSAEARSAEAQAAVAAVRAAAMHAADMQAVEMRAAELRAQQVQAEEQPGQQQPSQQPGQQPGQQQPGQAQQAPESPAVQTRAGTLPAQEQRMQRRVPNPAAEAARPEPGGFERDHNQPDPFRYDPLRPPAGYVSRLAPEAETAVGPGASETQADPAGPGPTGTEQPPPAAPPDEPPDVMILPEPNSRSRPTVAFEPGPVPGRSRAGAPRHGRAPAVPDEPLPRPTGSPAVDARLEKLENSPFWLSEQERAAQPEILPGPAHTAPSHRRNARRATRRPASALLALVTLALVATFFAWVSAEPFWLAMGHGVRGYATTTHCTGTGVTQHCAGQFAAADGRYTIRRVTLLGVDSGRRGAGAVTPARMVSPDSRQAYLGGPGLLVQLRWMLGFLLVLLCGYGIASLTGARRLEHARARRGAVLISLAGPLVLLAGFLFAAY